MTPRLQFIDRDPKRRHPERFLVRGSEQAPRADVRRFRFILGGKALDLTLTLPSRSLDPAP